MREKRYKASVKRSVDLDASFLDWYRVEFPNASIAWVINLCLHEFKEVYMKSKTPKRVATIASKRVTDRHL